MPIINFFTTTNSNICGCGNQKRTLILQKQNNNIREQNERIAQFFTVGTTLIASEEIIPFFNTQFNNISSNVDLNSDGTISLLTQGVYEITYTVVLSNPNANDIDVIVSLEKQTQTPVVFSRAISTLAPNATTTISNTYIDAVVSGTTQNIQLVNDSTEQIFVISANIVVRKIS